MKEFKLELNQRVCDQITGFRGIIVARAQYISQDNNYLVQPKCLDEREMPQPMWIDESRLE